MRERLALSFTLLSIALLVGAGAVQTYVQRDAMREELTGQLERQAQLVATIVADRQADGDVVDAVFLATLVGPRERLEYAAGDGTAVVRGDRYDGRGDVVDDVSATAVVAGPAGSDGQVTVSQGSSVVGDVVGGGAGSAAALLLLIAVVAGLVGFLIASTLSAPFQKLAIAAGALGRGRFDLALPKTRVPEARAIANALRSSAAALEDRVRRERAFAEHASHVLRTPLTGIRLEIEDLALRDDLPGDARGTVTRCLTRVDQVSAVAAELVDLTRRESLVLGAEVPLSDLSAQLAQRWADRLAARNRVLTAAVEGDLDATYTPGPVEHVTDLLLADVVRRGAGAVRIVFHGESGGHLRVQVTCAERATQRPADDPSPDRLGQVRLVVEALGGRIMGDHPADGIDVLLPRR